MHAATDRTAIWRSHYVHPGHWARSFTNQSVPTLLATSAARTPEAPALDFLGRRYSYGQLWSLVQRAAGGFAAHGVARGVKVGLFLPNCPQYVIAFYAVLLAGGTVVNFSPLQPADETARQIDDSGTTMMVTLDLAALYDVVAPLLGRTCLTTLIVGTLAEALPLWSGLRDRMTGRSARAVVPDDAAHLRFAALLAHRPLATPPAIDPLTDIALLQYSGGTTELPRGAMLTHANLAINAAQIAAVDSRRDVPERMLGVLPFFHIFANGAVLNQTILRGGLIVLLPRFDVGAVCAALVRHRITMLAGVPTMFRALLDQGNLRQLDLSNLRGCVSGGAPLPLALKYEFEGASGAKLVEGYGLTETAGVVSVNPYEGPGKPGSVGQPLPGTVVRIVDQDDATRAAVPDEPGEIVIAGPQVMQGYHGESASTADFITIDETRYFRTGDLGIIDAAGYVTVVDRINDVIEVGGVKVFPNHIQLVLYANPEVREAMVIGVADQRLGERPKAFITVMTGAEGSPAAFTAYVNARVGKYERLVDVEIRAALPKTAIGKLDRKRLIAEERAKMWAGR